MSGIRVIKFELDEACEARFSSNDKRGGNNIMVVTIPATQSQTDVRTLEATTASRTT
jgi:hypothetical protein